MVGSTESDRPAGSSSMLMAACAASRGPSMHEAPPATGAGISSSAAPAQREREREAEGERRGQGELAVSRQNGREVWAVAPCRACGREPVDTVQGRVRSECSCLVESSRRRPSFWGRGKRGERGGWKCEMLLATSGDSLCQVPAWTTTPTDWPGALLGWPGQGGLAAALCGADTVYRIR